MIHRLTEHVKGRRALQPLFERLQRVALIGMNYGRGAGLSTSGELWLLRSLAHGRRRDQRFVLFDVGANTGEYTHAALEAFGDELLVHAFEPDATAYASLEQRYQGDSRVVLSSLALGARDASIHLYSPSPGSTLASVHRRTIEDWNPSEISDVVVPVRTLASYCSEAAVERIDLLKIDVEGNELAVLQGAASLLESGCVGAIQWEFGPAHVAARTFLRDFFDLLEPSYRIQRLLSNGLRQVEYSTLAEVFFTANFYAEIA